MLRAVCLCLCPRRPQLAKGFMQLYSFEQQKSQPLEAHAAGFATMKVNIALAGTAPSSIMGTRPAGRTQLRHTAVAPLDSVQEP